MAEATVKAEIGNWAVCEDAQGEFYLDRRTNQSYDQMPPELDQLLAAYEAQAQRAAPRYAQAPSYAQPAQYAPTYQTAKASYAPAAPSYAQSYGQQLYQQVSVAQPAAPQYMPAPSYAPSAQYAPAPQPQYMPAPQPQPQYMPAPSYMQAPPMQAPMMQAPPMQAPAYQYGHSPQATPAMPPLFQHMLAEPFPSHAPAGAFGAPTGAFQGMAMPGMAGGFPGMPGY